MLFFLGSSYLLFSQQTICIGSKNNYWVDISENSGNGTTGSNYNWAVLEAGFKGSISKISTSGNRISVDWGATPVGNYTLRVTEDNSLCSNYQDLTVSIVEISNILNSLYKVCPGGNPVRIVAGNTTGYSYEWIVPSGVTNPGNSPFIDTNIPGRYIVRINNGYCIQEFSTEVLASDSPVITEIKEFPVGVVTIKASGGDTPLFFSVDGINWQSSGEFKNLKEGKTYTFRVRNSFGCEGLTKNFTPLWIPNVITPQNDGLNDRLIIKGIENFPNAYLQVYNRFGEKIFDSKSENTLIWDGKYVKRVVPTDTYWYVLDLGENLEKKTGYIVVKNRN